MAFTARLAANFALRLRKLISLTPFPCPPHPRIIASHDPVLFSCHTVYRHRRYSFENRHGKGSGLVEAKPLPIAPYY